MTLRLLTKHHLEFLSLKGGCTDSSESTLVKMPHCWKSHVAAHIYFKSVVYFVTKGKKKGKDQELIQSSTTPDPGYQWESDNFTIRHHKREPRGQPFSSR